MIVAAIMGGLATLMASGIARLLIGAGLGLVVYSGINAGADALLADFENQVSGLPATVLALLARAGVGEATEIIISTVLTVAAVSIAGRVAGLKKT